MTVSKYVSLLAWTSWFVLFWLNILGVIPWNFWYYLAFIALAGAAGLSGNPPIKK